MVDPKDLDTLKMLLGLEGDGKDPILTFLLDQVTDIVLSYCNLDAMPAGLKNTVVRMAADLYRSEGYGKEGAPTAASEVRRGDVTVKYTGQAVAEIAGAKGILDDYTAVLQQYRKLRW